MKKIFIVLGAGLLIIAGLVFAVRGHNQRQAQYQAGMNDVFLKRKQAWEQCLFKREFKHLLSPPTYQVRIYSGRYIEMLRAIDASNCPADFQSGWLEYLHALEKHFAPSREGKKREAVLRTADKSSLGGSVGATTSLHASTENDTKQELADEIASGDPQRALQNLDVIALRYGVERH